AETPPHLGGVFFWEGRSTVLRLDLDQLLLAPKASAVACQRTIRTNNAMARNDDGNLISAIGARYGAYCERLFYGPCNFAIASCLACPDILQFAPDVARECAPMQHQRNIEIGGSSCKERIKLLFQHIMRRISPYPDCTM